MKLRVLGLATLVACGGGGDDGGGDDGSSTISSPRCVDANAIDTQWAYNFTAGPNTLRANTLSIDNGGRVHTPPSGGAQVEVGSDAPNGTVPDSTTLELIWPEGDSEFIKLNIYFESDGVEWWASHLKHKDATIVNGDDWVEYYRELFRCPLGQAYVADTMFDADLPPSSITFEDLYVRAF